MTHTSFSELIKRGSLIVNDGYRTKQSELSTSGIPILRVAEVNDGFLSPKSADRINEDRRPSIGTKVSEPGDVLLTTKGTVGRRAIVPNAYGGFAYSPQLCFFRVLDDTIDSRWLYYWLGGPEFSKHSSGVSAQTDMAPYISLRDLRAMTIALPPLAEQRAIAATLGAFDEKIRSNQRIASLIPALIRARVESAIAEEGDLLPVADLATFTNGGAFTKGATGAGRMVIRIAELNSGPGNSTVYNDIEVPESKTARPGDLLMAWSGSLGVYRWYRDEAIINQHIFKVVPDGYPAWLVFDRLEAVMPVFRALAADKATTMGHIQRGHLKSTTASVPTRAAITGLDWELAPLWERLLLAERENLRLSRLRDALLPELLSGRLRTPPEAS